jgi:hypothetical protein
MTFVSDSGTGAPVFDYTSRDYLSIYQDLLSRIPVFLPEWTSQDPSDFGIVLLQMFAYVGDLIGYYLDRLAGEAFIQTATQPASIINLAAMLDYQPTLSVGSTVTLEITISNSTIGPYTIPAGSLFATASSPTQAPIEFITDAALTIAGANSATPSTTGSVVANQGTPYTNESVATSDGSVDQVYPLLHNPVSSNSFAVFVDLGLGPAEWTYASTLINAGPFDQVYTNFVDANGIFYIVFGDNVNGLVPPLGSPITATYQTNVGPVGNVGAGVITQSVSALVGLTSVTNLLPASGGASAESLTSIQVHAPASLKTLNRAVTADDLQTLAIQVPGVEWASAQEVTYQLVNLFIAPFGGGAPSTVLEAQVQNYVNPLVMANTTVTIMAPTYVPINVTANVVLFSNFGNTSTQTLVQTALATLLSLPNTGFGFRVSLGLVYETILSQLGVNYAIVTSLNRQMLVQLTTALVSGSVYPTLFTSPLPETVNAGDVIILNPGGASTQSLVASVQSPAGTSSISVTAFTANANYAIGTSVQDATGVQDAVMLINEIPVAGTFTISVSGGLAGS